MDFSVCYSSIKQCLEIKECREIIFPHCVWKNYANCIDVTTLQYISIFEVFPNIHVCAVFYPETFVIDCLQ